MALYHQLGAWKTLQHNGMKTDFSWKNSGGIYADLYRELVDGQ